MTDYVYDGVTLPAGKSDFRPASAPANKSYTAAEWNTHIAATESLKSAVLQGKYHGLVETNDVTASNPGFAKWRLHGGALQASVDGGAWHNLADKDPGTFNVRTFGAVGDGVTDDYPAFMAALAAMGSTTFATVLGRVLEVPPATYRISKPIRLTRPVIFQGTSAAGYTGARLLVDAGQHGIIVERFNTSFDYGAGDWSTIRDLKIVAAGKTTTAHGIVMRARCTVDNCVVEGFKGNGIHIDASSSGSSEVLPNWLSTTDYALGDSVQNDSGKWYICKVPGTSAGSGGPTGTSLTISDGSVTWGYVSGLNANNWFVLGGRADFNGGHGLFVDGIDANAGNCIGFSATGNDGWGIYDSSFLGNTYIGAHTDANILGPYKSDSANSRSLFLGCYAEGNQPASQITYPAQVIGGLHAPGVIGNGWSVQAGRMTQTQFDLASGDGFLLVGDVNTNAFNTYYANGAGNSVRQNYHNSSNAYSKDTVVHNYAGGSNLDGFGFALERGTYDANGRTRRMSASQLFTTEAYGIINEGYRISHADDPLTLVDPGRTQALCLEGDLVFRRTQVAGGAAGWVCTARGTTGTYTEGRTVTSAGGTSLTLSAATGVNTGIRVGDRILVNGVTAVNVDSVSTDLLTLGVSGSVPAGSGLSIAYVAPTFTEFGHVVGNGADSTATPGNVTQNTNSGRVAIAAGANSVTVTNSKCTSTSRVYPVLQTLDATLTSVPVCVPANGSFTIYGNANATAAVNVGWELR